MEQNIDFDEASYEWRKNKISLPNGYFKYKCSCINCNEIIYLYTTTNKYFHIFATKFDIENKDNPNKYLYCEEHLNNDNNK
jgi:hypothetical protein